MSLISEMQALIDQKKAALAKQEETISNKIADLKAQIKKLEKDRNSLFAEIEEAEAKLTGKKRRGGKRGRPASRPRSKSDFTGKWKVAFDKKRNKYVIHHETATGEWKGRPGPLSQDQQDAVEKASKKK